MDYIEQNAPDHILKVLARTRELLGDGKRWKANKIATNRLGIACDPLSPWAHHFGLAGAAARASWELRQDAPEPREGDIRIVHIVQAMSSVPASPYGGELGWRHVDSILSGLEAVLTEYLETDWDRSSSLRA